MRLRLESTACTAVLLALGACADAGEPIAPAPAPAAAMARAPQGDLLATVEWDKGTPMLFVQQADGTGRVRVHFDHVSDHVAGNYSQRQLPVTDETIRAIPRMKWSPDGRYLAVIVAPSIEALQVVLVSADGRALRTVSPNSQYLWGDVEWSLDGRRIAYVMATAPSGRLPELFITDLGSDRVTRVTTGARLTGHDAIRFDASGARLHFTERLGWADDGVNGLSRLASVDLASGAVTTADTVVGEPQGLSRDGSWALFMRADPANPGFRELFRRSADGSEMVLASGDLRQAVALEGDREALLYATLGKDAVESFSVIGLDRVDDVRRTLRTEPTAAWAAFWQAVP